MFYEERVINGQLHYKNHNSTWILFTTHMLNQRIIELENRTKQEWISVDCDLPKDDNEYLIWPHGKYAGSTATFWPWGDENGHKNNTFEMESEYGELTQVHVTHWMPLPIKE